MGAGPSGFIPKPHHHIHQLGNDWTKSKTTQFDFLSCPWHLGPCLDASCYETAALEFVTLQRALHLRGIQFWMSVFLLAAVGYGCQTIALQFILWPKTCIVCPILATKSISKCFDISLTGELRSVFFLLCQTVKCSCEIPGNLQTLSTVSDLKVYSCGIVADRVFC